MVLGGQNHIAHPRFFSRLHPGFRICCRRIKFPKERHILLLRHPFIAAHPFPPGRNGIKPPVNEHAKASLHKPLHTLFISGAFKAIHISSLPVKRCFTGLSFEAFPPGHAPVLYLPVLPEIPAAARCRKKQCPGYFEQSSLQNCYEQTYEPVCSRSNAALPADCAGESPLRAVSLCVLRHTPAYGGCRPPPPKP